MGIDGSLIDKFRTFLFGKLLDLERHEYVAVAWSFGLFFCVLSSYYILRPVREAMAIVSGTHTIPNLFLATFFAMLIATPIFGWVASRFPRRVFLPWVYLFFVANLFLFWAFYSYYAATDQESIWVGRTFFVWLSVFNLFVVSVFWSFMADIYTREQGRRLFGLITSGGSIGALLGGLATSFLVVRVGFHNLFPIAATLLIIGIFCITRLRKWVAQEHENEIVETVESDKPLGGNPFSGITHVFSSKYFSGIAIASIIATLLGSALYIFAAQRIGEAIPGTDEQARFFANMNNVANVISLIAQMFLVKQVVTRFGIGVSLSLLPILSVASFAVLAVDPVLGVIVFITVARRGLGFGFTKPTTDMLYSVVTPEQKYKTKNFIDTAVHRIGDVVGTRIINLLTDLGISGISLVMLPFAIIWALIALWLGRDYRCQARQLKNRGIA